MVCVDERGKSSPFNLEDLIKNDEKHTIADVFLQGKPDEKFECLRLQQPH